MAHKNLIRCDEQTLAKNLSGRVYLVTGANSGVGLETTRQLIKQGAHVVMACRRPQAGEAARETFAGLKGTSEVMQCDLADLQSVRDFADKFQSKFSRLDGLMCNAGMVNMKNKPIYSKEGFEITWAASYFGHFLLTESLLGLLKQTGHHFGLARIAMISSVVHAGSPKNRPAIHLDDLNYKNRKYNNFAAYGEAKVAVVLYMKELAARLKGSNVVTASIHPGWARSNFGSGGSIFIRAIMALAKPLTYRISDSSWEAAQASLHVLLSDDAPKHSGAYFSQHSVLYRDKQCKKGGFPMQTPNPNADDMAMAEKLVAATYPLVGLK